MISTGSDDTSLCYNLAGESWPGINYTPPVLLVGSLQWPDTYHRREAAAYLPGSAGAVMDMRVSAILSGPTGLMTVLTGAIEIRAGAILSPCKHQAPLQSAKLPLL